MSEPRSTLWRRSVCHGCFSMLYNNGAETIKCRFLVLFNPNRIEHASQVIESRLGASVLWALSWFQIPGRIASWIFCTWKAHGSVKVGIELLQFQSQKCCEVRSNPDKRFGTDMSAMAVSPCFQNNCRRQFSSILCPVQSLFNSNILHHLHKL